MDHMTDHGIILRTYICGDFLPQNDEQALAALAALEQELAEAKQRVRELEADPDRPTVVYAGDELEAAEAERDEAQRLAVTASEECEEWRKKAGVTEYHLLRRHATEKRLVDEEDRAEAAEAEGAALRKALEEMGMDMSAWDAAALAAVRQWGGVLEHPAYSLAWGRHDLHRPSRGYWGRSFTDEGWVTEVSQVAYGHPARKRTWLYYVGENLPPALRWNEPEWTSVIGGGIHSGQSQGSPKLTGYPSSETPLSFRDALIDMARTAHLTDSGFTPDAQSFRPKAGV